MDMTNDIVKRLSITTGALPQKWGVPRNYRQWAAGVRKIMKCYFNFQAHKLFWPELLTNYIQLVQSWRRIGAAFYVAPGKKNNALYFNALDDISQWDVQQYKAGEVSIEEARDRVQGLHCSMCRSTLVWPAYIVHRMAVSTEIVNRSHPLGIRCLHSYKGKFQKLLTDNDFQDILNRVSEAEKAKEYPAIAEVLEQVSA